MLRSTLYLVACFTGLACVNAASAGRPNLPSAQAGQASSRPEAGQQQDGNKPTHPILLIPGLAGSVLDAKLDRNETVSWFCTKVAAWRVLYLSFREALYPDCLCDEMMVFYDAATGEYSNQAGVQIRPHDYGGLAGVAALDPAEQALTATYLPLINALKSAGYEERVTLWGAPYDWRLAADGLVAAGAADDMRSLIELACATAGHRPAVVVAHSMGNLVLSYFLSHWGAAWVRRHIKEVVAVSGPFGGAVQAVKGPISGDNFQMHFPHGLLHRVQAAAPSGPWLFPLPALWGHDEVIVRTRSRAYSAHALRDLLQDAGLDALAAAYPGLLRLHADQLSHDVVTVPLTCVYGDGVDTDAGYVYAVERFGRGVALPEPTAIRTREGDGTVNRRSLLACMKIGREGQTREVRVANASHVGILSAPQLINAVHRASELRGSPEGMAQVAARTQELAALRRRRGSAWLRDALLWRSATGAPRRGSGGALVAAHG